MKATVDIFSGFLGAGKTMLIKKLLCENAYGKNTVIIENEFGEVGIDGEILKETNINVKEINSGCICCQVSGNFGDAVIEVLKKYEPENIIIEPSGVAKLSEILKILDGIKFQHVIEVRNIFTLIDIQNYDMYLNNFKEFYENQIKNANKIVISRTQFCDEKKISKTVDSLKRINKKAEIIWKPWDQLRCKDFYTINNSSAKKSMNIGKVLNVRNKNVQLKKEISHDADDIFESYPIDLEKNINSEELKKKFLYIEDKHKYGDIIRAKGVFKDENGVYFQFDYVPNEFKMRKIKWSNKKVVSIIGSNLNKVELRNLFV
ncbi:MAG: GTP-binding protein [Clostridium sp.]|nr:GTP-binding protein [Clostridium sp.]